MKEDEKSKKQYRKMQKRKRKNFKFSDKTHPVPGLLSFFFGIAALVSIAVSSIISFRAQGNAGILIGFLGFLSMLLSIAGIILSIIALRRKDIHYRFPVAGGILCGFLTLFYIILYVIGCI